MRLTSSLTYFVVVTLKLCVPRFDSVVAKAAEEFPEHVNAIEGTVTHKQILGDTLEGLVIHAYKTDDDCDVPHNEVVRAIDSGNTAVIKFKFPA